jgi:hypothetical protein
MSDTPDDAVSEPESAAADSPASDGADGGEPDPETEDIEALRAEVDQKYDFENFGPQDMAEMDAEEWEAAFDADTWITGEELLDRVEADVKHRVVTRDVFARVERFDDMLIAYSDSGYAAVYPDGTVEGSGTVLRDVKPTVALCSMDSYDVPEMPDGEVLPEPQEIPDSSDALGNTVLQVVAAVQLLAGVGLLGAWALYLLELVSPPGGGTGANLWLIFVIGIGFIGIGLFLFLMVANARLSDRYRSEEFRNRLRAVGLEDGERPDFLDDLDGEVSDRLAAATGGESPEADAPEESTDDVV